jgi:hypothetical protein
MCVYYGSLSGSMISKVGISRYVVRESFQMFVVLGDAGQRRTAAVAAALCPVGESA